jgi:hypothetical protein
VGEDRAVVEADGAPSGGALGAGGQRERLRDHRRVVLVGDAHGARQRHLARREDPLPVALFRDDDAVGGREDRAREGVELGALLLPGVAIVAGEVGVVAQLGVHVGRHHLAVGVDLDRRALAGLEQLHEIHHVVARDEDARSSLRALLDFHHAGRAQHLGVRLVEHLHDAEVHLAALQDEAQRGLEVEVDVGHRREERLLHEGVDRGIGAAQAAGMAGVGAHALEAVEQDLLEALDVLVLAADAVAGGRDLATGAVEGLFTLIAGAHASSGSGCGAGVAIGAGGLLDPGQAAGGCCPGAAP